MKRSLPIIGMTILTAAVGALFACDSKATEYHGVLHGLSKHATEYSRSGSKWNETNVGAGIRLKESDDLSYQFGIYHNSQRHVSGYAIADWTPLHLGPISAGISGGVVTGYEAFPVMPAVTLAFRGTVTSRIDVMVRWLPPVSPKLTSVAAIEMSWRF